MKSHLFYIKRAFRMSKKSIQPDINSMEYSDYNLSPEDFVNSLSLDDYLNNKKTKNILLNEHQYQYDNVLRYKISKLYSLLNQQFNDHLLFLSKEQDNIGGDNFADFVYNFIQTKYHLNIFKNEPKWTVTLF